MCNINIYDFQYSLFFYIDLENFHQAVYQYIIQYHLRHFLVFQSFDSSILYVSIFSLSVCEILGGGGARLQINRFFFLRTLQMLFHCLICLVSNVNSFHLDFVPLYLIFFPHLCCVLNFYLLIMECTSLNETSMTLTFLHA